MTDAKVVKVDRREIAAARLRMALDRLDGVPSDPRVEKIAHARWVNVDPRCRLFPEGGPEEQCECPAIARRVFNADAARARKESS